MALECTTLIAAFPAPLWLALGLLVAFAAFAVGFALVIELVYADQVARMFSQAPVFKPLRGEPDPGGEDVHFRTPDGLELCGTYYPAFGGPRRGVVVFCHEFLGDRHGAYEYAGHLREEGFDIFAYDCRNHGDSQSEPGYEIIHWVSDREVTDLRAALDSLLARPDADPAGVALFGVSRGGGTALCAAADDPRVWAIVTDGAFPTATTMLHNIRRRAIILIREFSARVMPDTAYRYVGWAARRRMEHRLGRRFPSIERAARRVPPRPWLAIHGASDAYIEPAILEDLVRGTGAAGSTEVWMVPGAKHNQCREVAPGEYRRRVAEFLLNAAPRRPAATAPVDVPASVPVGGAADPRPLASSGPAAPSRASV